jgi:hypothetical protein
MERRRRSQNLVLTTERTWTALYEQGLREWNANIEDFMRNPQTQASGTEDQALFRRRSSVVAPDIGPYHMQRISWYNADQSETDNGLGWTMYHPRG